MSTAPAHERRRWEHKALAILEYPANLAFAGMAAFLLSLPLVTWLSAWVAVGQALHAWRTDGDDRVFTNTVRAFAATWRRTLPASVAATAIVAIMTIDVIFLGTRDTPVAFLFGAATVPFAVALVLVATLLPAVAARRPDGTMRDWSRMAVVVAASRPVASLGLAAVVVAFGLTCVLLPTIVPFLAGSVPVWLGLAAAGGASVSPRG